MAAAAGADFGPRRDPDAVRRNTFARPAGDCRELSVAIHYRHQERMRLARKAVIAEIRDKGRRVNSIAPEELNRLIESYLKDHRWEFAIKEFGCS